MSHGRAVGWTMAAVVAGMVLSGCAADPNSNRGASAPPPSQQASSVPTTAASQPVASPDADSEPASGPGTVSCEYPASGQPARPVDPPPTKQIPATGTLTVTLQLTEGPVVITMDRAAAPCTVNSFESLVKQGYYDQTSCHRLVDQGIYILQCGDPGGTGRGGPGYRFADELSSAKALPAGPQGSVIYQPGTIAMANAGPNTNGSQFFLIWADTPLRPDYTLFGSFDEPSLAVVTTIASRGISAEKAPNPISPAKIESVSLG